MGKKEEIVQWAVAALVRAVKTMAQAAVALIGTNAIGVTEVDWAAVASAAALAAVLSVLTSVAGIPEASDGQSPLAATGGGGDDGR